MSDEHHELTDEELEAQQSDVLPDREVLSLLPNLGGTGMLSDPLGAAGTGGTPDATGGAAPGTGGALPGADTTGAAPSTSGITGVVTNLAQHAADKEGDEPYSPTDTSSASSPP